MAQEVVELAALDLGDAGFEVAPPLKADAGTLGLGSRNIIGFGRKNRRAFKGLTAITSGSRIGSRVMLNAGGKIGGLADVSGNEAKGSVDVYLRNTIWFMGFGQLIYDSVAVTGAVASTTQKVLVRYNGSFTHANSGPYDAGLPQPSPPEVELLDEVGSGFTGKITGLTSFMLASIRSWTGDRSRASYVSVTILGDKQTARFKFPEAPVGGTGWVIFAPKLGFGGTGVHWRMRSPNRIANREFLESDIERTVTDVVTNSTTTITSATAVFTSADIGKHVLLDNGVTEFEAVIESVTNATTALLDAAVTFTSTGVEGTFTAYTGGVLRSVEIDYDDTDLTSEAAWIADYPPPAGTYSFPLVDVRVVAGCLSDAVTDPTVSDAGTCLAVSERNYPGSYDPLKLLYIPEKFVGGIGRSTDTHHFIFCKNWTGACQYTGADLGPACTISTVWADTGFVRSQNVCLMYGRIYGFSAKGSAVRLANGEEPDMAFAEKVRPVFANWDPDNVVVQPVPHLQAVMYAHKREAYLFYIQNEQWLPAVYLTDFATGEIKSALAIDQKIYLTMKDGSNFNLFEFDAGSGSTCSAVTNYIGQPVEARAKTIHELAETLILDSTLTYYVSLHRNAERLSIDDVVMTNGSNLVTSASAAFTATDEGKFVIIFGAGAAGVPILGRIKAGVTSTTCRIVTTARPLGTTAINAAANVSGGHMIIADLIYSRTSPRTGSQHQLGTPLNFRNCYSYAIGISIISNGTSASAVKAIIYGNVKSGRAGKPTL